MDRLEDYQALAMRTSPAGHDAILNGCLGLIGEAGEVVDLIKKWRFQSGKDAPFPAAKLAEEIGDVAWYCAELCKGLDIDLARVIRETRESWADCTPAPVSPEYDAFTLANACGMPYGHYYDANVPGVFERPRILSPTKVRQMKGYRRTDEAAPVAYPTALSDDEAWSKYDTIANLIGDITSICEMMLRQYADMTLEQAMQKNIDKLRRRYPDGFDPTRSMKRD